MKSAILRKTGHVEESPLELGDAPVPIPGKYEALIKVEACAVCRTDVQICEGDLTTSLPRIPGHQIVGRIVDVGGKEHSELIGNRVGVTWLAQTCETCQFCMTGRENLCRQAKFTGFDRDGGFAEYTVANVSYATPLNETRDAVEIAPLLCGGVIGYRALRRAGLGPNEAGQKRVGLFGFGSSATLSLPVAKHWNWETYVFTGGEDEQQRARQLGATWVGDYNDDPGELLDCAVSFAPTWEVAISKALPRVIEGGNVTINAITLTDSTPQIDYHNWLWKERSIQSVANVTRQDIREFLQLANEMPIRTTFTSYPLSEVNQAMRDAASRKIAGSAVLDMAASR